MPETIWSFKIVEVLASKLYINDKYIAKFFLNN